MEVLVPVNGPNTTRASVRHAVTTYPDATITVLHVQPPTGSYASGMGGMYMHGSVIESQRDRTESLFEAALVTAAELDGSVTTRTAVGRPVRQILSVADELESDHIVIGPCRRSGFSRLLWGNVTEAVVRGAAVPVTVVA